MADDIHLYLAPDVKRRLQEIAQQQRRSLTKQVEFIVLDALAKLPAADVPVEEKAS